MMLANSTDNTDLAISFYHASYPNQQLLIRHLQPWFTRYTPQTASLQMALYHSQILSLYAQRAFATQIRALKSARDFARPLLNEAMQRTFGVNADCRYIYLQEVMVAPAGSPPQTRVEELPIVLAALQNFEAQQKFHSGTALYYRTTPYPPEPDGFASGNLADVCGTHIACSTGYIDISPTAFAEMCRSLDLGGKYQAHLHSLFGATSSTAKDIAEAFALRERCRLKVLSHIARLQGQIGQQAYTAVLEVAKPDSQPLWDTKPVRYSQLELFASQQDSGYALHGALIIQANASGSMVVYMPGEPNHPLKEYASLAALQGYLREHLDDPGYRRYFARFIPLNKQQAFFERLDKTLRPQGILAVTADLGLQAKALGDAAEPFDSLYKQVLLKLYADAAVLAVPSANRKAAATSGGSQILKTLAQYGFELIDAFLPVSEVRDLVKDAVVAVESWSAGDQEKALHQLYRIGKDLVSIAAPKAAGKIKELEKIYEDGKQAVELTLALLNPPADKNAAATAVVPSIDSDDIAELQQPEASATRATAQPSALIEGLAQVSTEHDRLRLWNPDLKMFEYQGTLPKDTELDARSLFRTHGRTWLGMEGRFYEIAFDEARQQWRALNPNGRPQYAPTLETNGAGAWLIEGENPMSWDAYKALRRLHGHCASFDDTTIDHILRITGVDEALLRQIHVDKLVPPALLIDCIQRFLIDRMISAFIALMKRISDAAPGANEPVQARGIARIEPYLDFIVTLPGWPESRVLRQLDGQGQVLSVHAPGNSVTRHIDVQYSPANLQALLKSLLAGLSAVEVESLLVSYHPPQSREQYLAARIAAEIEGRRKVLLDLIYADRNASNDPLIKLLQRDFRSLPFNVAKEIIDFADKNEIRRMEDSGRLPLRLAEQARQYLQQVRVNRTLECFYLHMESDDKDMLCLELVSLLPEWPKDLVIEVRKNSFDGQRLFHSGGKHAPAAATDVVLVQKGSHYQLFNGQGQPAHIDTRRLMTTLYSASQLTRQINDLDLVLGNLATGQRARVEQALGLKQIKPGIQWPSRLADGRLGYPLSGRARQLFGLLRGNASAFSPELAVKQLYPQFTAGEVRRFLEQLSAPFSGTTQHKQNLTRARLNELRQEYVLLKNTLDAWLAEVRHPAPRARLPADASIDGREIARIRILACWRRERRTQIDPQVADSGHQLDLSNLALGALPDLPANFEHVQALKLNSIGLSTEATNRLVRRFSKLQTLSLNRNRIEAVPQALASLSGLTHLELSRNPLTVDALGLHCLERLSALKTLHIEGAPTQFTVAIDASRWPALVDLRLRVSGLGIMPTGLGVNEPLRHVDLRHNAIIDIDEATLRQIVARATLYVRLHGNPLSDETIATARTLMDNITLVRMGIQELPDLTLPSETTRQWLSETGTAEQHQRWADLRQESGGEAFVQLINELFWTADYRDNRHLLNVRLWRMIDEMTASAALREELFNLAAHPQTCGDGTMIVFNSLDVRVLVHQLKSSLGTVTPLDMFKLVRGLERLSELEKIAVEDFNARLPDHPGLDQVEVRLIYPTRLQEALELPGQSQGMLFEMLAGVDQATLDRARQRVLAREHTGEFLQAMVERTEWLAFLEEHYQARFEALNRPFHERQHQLDLQREALTDDAYLDAVNALAVERKQAVQALATQITQEIQLQATPASGKPASAD